MNSQSIVNGSTLPWILDSVTGNPFFLFQYRREGKFLGVVCFEILYNQSKRTTGSNQKKEGFLFVLERYKENGIQDPNQINKKKKRNGSVIPPKRRFSISILYHFGGMAEW